MLQGRVRFHDSNEAKTAIEKAKEAGDGKVIMEGAELTCSVLEGQFSLTVSLALSLFLSLFLSHT